MKHIRPMIFFVTLLMLVSLACSALSGGGGNAPTQEPVQPATEPATKPPENQGGNINSVDQVKDATIQICSFNARGCYEPRAPSWTRSLGCN